MLSLLSKSNREKRNFTLFDQLIDPVTTKAHINSMKFTSESLKPGVCLKVSYIPFVFAKCFFKICLKSCLCIKNAIDLFTRFLNESKILRIHVNCFPTMQVTSPEIYRVSFNGAIPILFINYKK